MNPLKDLCNEVFSAGEKATPRPWVDELDFPHTMVLQNIKYIVTSANSADKLAKACLVLMEALESIQCDSRAQKALAEAQAIVGEK